MKTPAQQYHDLLRLAAQTIERCSPYTSIEVITNFLKGIFENFAVKNLPSDFEYKYKYEAGKMRAHQIYCYLNGEEVALIDNLHIPLLNQEGCLFQKIRERISLRDKEINEMIEEQGYKMEQVGTAAKESEQHLVEEQQEVKLNPIMDAMNKLQKEYPNFERAELFFRRGDICDEHFVRGGKGEKYIQQYKFANKPSTKELDEFNRLFPDFQCFFMENETILYIERKAKPIQEEVEQIEVKDDLYSDIEFNNAEFNSFIENDSDLNLEMSFDTAGRLSLYDNGILALTGSPFNVSLFNDMIKLGMYIERRNQLNKKQNGIII